jgi:hypothetical protein
MLKGSDPATTLMKKLSIRFNIMPHLSRRRPHPGTAEVHARRSRPTHAYCGLGGARPEQERAKPIASVQRFPLPDWIVTPRQQNSGHFVPEQNHREPRQLVVAACKKTHGTAERRGEYEHPLLMRKHSEGPRAPISLILL